MEPTPLQPSSAASLPSRQHHTVAQRAILALNIVVVIACLVGAGALLYGKNELDSRLQTERVEVQTTTAPAVTVDPNNTASTITPETFPAADPLAQNFLVTGSDANSCADPNSVWAGGAAGREGLGSRSDTIMVMRIDPVSRAAAVLSFPRDLWIKIPGHGKNRINAAYVENDYSLLAQTLSDNFGIEVDHYLQVDFCAFKRIVDAVGGVAVPFDTPIIDTKVGIYVHPDENQTLPFCHTFSGDEALAYVRSRHLKWIDAQGVKHEDNAADLGRISRQQDFLRRALRAALDKGLFNPSVARGILSTLQNDIVTESGFTVDDMLKFAGVMHDVNPESIHTYQVESYGKVISANAVQMPVDSENMRAILAIFQGTAPLLGAPDQVTGGTTTVATPTSGTTGTTAAPTTVAGAPVSTLPADNTVGQILPPDDVKC
ncbi:MAG: LCP family protein [Actinomycetota bacterium]|nr:LCP family protein [Actinomycetota bacterium]